MAGLEGFGTEVMFPAASQVGSNQLAPAVAGVLAPRRVGVVVLQFHKGALR